MFNRGGDLYWTITAGLPTHPQPPGRAASDWSPGHAADPDDQPLIPNRFPTGDGTAARRTQRRRRTCADHARPLVIQGCGQKRKETADGIRCRAPSDAPSHARGRRRLRPSGGRPRLNCNGRAPLMKAEGPPPMMMLYRRGRGPHLRHSERGGENLQIRWDGS